MKVCAATFVVFASLPHSQAIWWPFGSTKADESRAPERAKKFEDERDRFDRGRPELSSSRLDRQRPKMPSYEYDYYYYDELIPLQRSGDYYYYYQDNLERQSAGSSINPLAALIAPLAGLALLGAASAVAVNPILLELVTIKRNRKRRETLLPAKGEKEETQLKQQINQLRVLETFLSSMPSKWSQAELLTAGYLSCSGLGRPENQCLEQLTCMYATNSTFNNIEKDVTSIVLYNLMSNKILEQDLKRRIRKAARIGRDRKDCSIFSCDLSSSLEESLVTNLYTSTSTTAEENADTSQPGTEPAYQE